MDRIKEVSEKTLNFYKNGKYNDDVRMVYEDLLSTRLSTRNVERCVRLVLEKLAEAKVGRLPKVTFAKDMFLEARGLAQIHVVKVTGQQRESIYSDGTSKNGHSYTTFDVQSGEDVFIVGLREVGGADAQTHLDLFKDVLEDVSGSLSKGNGNGNFTNLVFKSIKNLMSDCCATHTKKLIIYLLNLEKSCFLMLLKIGKICLMINNSL